MTASVTRTGLEAHQSTNALHVIKSGKEFGGVRKELFYALELPWIHLEARRGV